MPFPFALLSLLALFAANVTLAAEDAPYIGKWKTNVEKSDFGGSTLTYAKTSPEEFQVTSDGQTYTFRMDGKDYPSSFGTTAAWKQIDARTWQSTHKIDGKKLWTRTATVSPDGKSMRVDYKGTAVDGTPVDDVIVYERVSGDAGLVGKWKTTNVSYTPGVMELSPYGADGLTITIPAMGLKVSAKFDGKDYPSKGPTFGPGYTIALRKTGPRSFEQTIKHEGEPLYVNRYVVSADGKTLTETGEALKAGEKYTAVHERQ